MHVIRFHIRTTRSDDMVLEQRFWIMWRIHNMVVSEAKKRIRTLRRNKEYQYLMAHYADDPDDKPSERLSELRKEVGLTMTDLEKFAKHQQHKYRKFVSSTQVQKEADRVWSNVSKVLFGNGRDIHFKKYDSFDTISQKTPSNGVKYTDGCISWGDDIRCQVDIDWNDPYVAEAMLGTIKFIEIKRIMAGTKYRYYAQFYIDGDAPEKIVLGSGTTGADIGVSTVATVSSEDSYLATLAERSVKYDLRIRRLQRKIERSMRYLNPGNYNADGTVKRGKHTWVLSKRCRRLKVLLRDTYRRKTAYTHDMHGYMTNRIVSQADTVVIEPMNWQGLARRSKKTERQDKESAIVRKDGTVLKVCKYKRKKRFGRSVGNRSPGLFCKMLENKITRYGGLYLTVDSISFRASQYDHTDGSYTKVSMTTRDKRVGGHYVQRDLYSAFLLMNTAEDLTHPDPVICRNAFYDFLKHQHRCITQMKKAGISNKSCFGF